MSESAKTNWFDQGGKAYAKFRPEYPTELSKYLSSLASDSELAIDVGCGNGQLTTQLAPYFKKVMGIDPSQDQIANAAADAKIEYFVAPAEKLPVPERSASLITVAQAAHWFDLPRFYSEVTRIAKPQSAMALISYGLHELEPVLMDRFNDFYWKETAPYWPAERKLVDNGYRDLAFPFKELTPPKMEISLQWNLSEFLGYISTWSAVRKIREADRLEILHNFAEDITQLWDAPETKRQVTWPLNMRIGKIA